MRNLIQWLKSKTTKSQQKQEALETWRRQVERAHANYPTIHKMAA